MVVSVSYTSSITTGARPSDSSSVMRSLGARTRTRASESIRCSPPDSVPAIWLAPLPQPREQLVRLASGVVGPPPPEHLTERQRQVLLDAQRREHRSALGRVDDPESCEPERTPTGHLGALEQQTSRGRPDESGAHPHDGRLARSVGSEQRHDRVRLDRERHAEQRPERPVAGVDVAQLEQGHAGGHTTSPR